jgi:hypothetical protein
MAMPKKTFLNEEGQLVKKCQGECGEVLPVEKFYTRVQAGKYTVYDSKCRECKSKYNRQWTIGREKRSRKAITTLENTLESVRSVVIDWKEVIDFAMKHPLATGFKTPQEFVLSTLKTVYDGRPKKNL